MATIMDVARLAGVSRSTVSRVLNNSSQVDQKTKKKILTAIKELNYQPSIVARNLRKQETKLIAVLIPNISNTFFSKLVQGIEDAAVRKGYNIILCNTGDDLEREMYYIKMLEKKQIDGIILTALRNPINQIKPYLQYGPIIFACEFLDNDFLPSVCIDNAAAAKKATEHLITLGHQRIALINGPEKIILCRDRKKGYLQALKEHGISVCTDFIQHSDFTIKGGYDSTEKFLKLLSKPTAIFAANDEMGIGAIKAIQKNRYQVPNDIAVIGFDNIPICTVIEPKLTTIDQPIYQMGTEAIELLLKCLKEGIDTVLPRRIILQAKLHIRESCGF